MSAPLLRRVVFLDAGTLPQRLVFDPALHIDYQPYAASAPGQVAQRIAEAEVVITNKVALTAELLAAAPLLRLVCVAAAGTDNIDFSAATRHGIAVRNVPDYGSDSVAEHTIALLLALRRAIVPSAQAARDGRWSRAGQFCWHGPALRDVGGSVLGIVGRGRIGEATARLARGLGLQVLFAHRAGHVGGDVGGQGDCCFDTLLSQVDALSLHLPLTPETRGLIDARRLALMKPGAVLVNTSRGALVDSVALAAALRSGRLAGAALDVLDTEPPSPDHPLLAPDIPNLLLTPHVAWASEQAQARLAGRLVELVHQHLGALPAAAPAPISSGDTR
ncbi:NAD(P)-dependent oxidoreductase [Aquabacterium sp.]|uniref:NAD(P)-dependent oxidoreductase n=1 Tax=Aquabacterium sp. TaxID=1872578 RepID=UPI00378427BD